LIHGRHYKAKLESDDLFHSEKFKNYQSQLAIFGLLFGAVCWGVIWYPYRIMQAAGISGVVSSLYTYVIALTISALIFCKQWRSVFKQPKSIIWLALIAGWTNLSYVLAIIDGEVMRVMLLFYLSPLWTLILAHFWLKERTNWQGVIIIALSLVGAFTMFWQADALPLPKNHSEWLALSSGMGFALTNVITRHSTHLSIPAKSIAVWVGVVLMSLLFMLLQRQALPELSLMNTNQWLMMVLIALLLMSATFLVQFGITHIPVTKASVLFMFELVVAAVASYYLTDETLSAREWLGGCLIVAAALFAAISHSE
jgi:drug/metabolite transporter (DMT)-like permease